MSDIVTRAKAAMEGAYEGPWIQVGHGNIHTDPVGARPPVAKTWTRGNGEFIAASRELVPELIAEIERMRDLVRRGLPRGDQFRTPYAAGARAELRRMSEESL